MDGFYDYLDPIEKFEDEEPPEKPVVETREEKTVKAWRQKIENHKNTIKELIRTCKKLMNRRITIIKKMKLVMGRGRRGKFK